MPPSPTSFALPLGTLLGDYEVQKLLGQGEFGIVYAAIDRRLNRVVAIKEHCPKSLCYRNEETASLIPLRPDLAETYEYSLNYYWREAHILAQLNSPYIAQIFDVFQACGTAYIVMSFIEGVTLDEWIETHKTEPQEIVRILMLLLDAFDYIHQKDIFHRDVKPSNIIMTAADQPVLVDFGAALEGYPQGTITLIGSPAFAAPEQFIKGGQMGPWSDLYALGRSFQHILGKDVHHFSKNFQRALLKSVLAEPEQRFPSAQAWKSALQPRQGGAYKLLAGLLVSVLLLAGLGVYYLTSDKPAPAEVVSIPPAQPKPITPPIPEDTETKPLSAEELLQCARAISYVGKPHGYHPGLAPNANNGPLMRPDQIIGLVIEFRDKSKDYILETPIESRMVFQDTIHCTLNETTYHYEIVASRLNGADAGFSVCLYKENSIEWSFQFDFTLMTNNLGTATAMFRNREMTNYLINLKRDEALQFTVRVSPYLIQDYQPEDWTIRENPPWAKPQKNLPSVAVGQ